MYILCFQHEEVIEKTLVMASANGGKTSLYESLKQAGATTILESLQAQVKMRDGEITQLQVGTTGTGQNEGRRNNTTSGGYKSTGTGQNAGRRNNTTSGGYKSTGTGQNAGRKNNQLQVGIRVSTSISQYLNLINNSTLGQL